MPSDFELVKMLVDRTYAIRHGSRQSRSPLTNLKLTTSAPAFCKARHSFFPKSLIRADFLRHFPRMLQQPSRWTGSH